MVATFSEPNAAGIFGSTGLHVQLGLSPTSRIKYCKIGPIMGPNMHGNQYLVPGHIFGSRQILGRTFRA